MKAAKNPTRQIPPMLPREKLTRKARAAIHKFVDIKGEKVHRIGYFMIDLVLEAERMRRADLYEWPEKQGCRWQSGYWLRRIK